MGGGMGHGGFGGMGHAGFGFGGGHFGGGHFGGMHVATAHPVMMFGHGFHGHHRFFRNRFVFVGGGGGWGYSGCYTRVWTYWGWTWRNVCY
jgi:hypothetical protein